MSGRYSVAGIPVSNDDNNALKGLRNILGYANPIIHIGLGSVVQKKRAPDFNRVYDKLRRLGRFGRLKKSTRKLKTLWKTLY